MKFTSLVEEMKTVRDFKKEPVNNSLIERVLETGNKNKDFVKNPDVSIIFIEKGIEAYDTLSGKAGYYGKMIEAPHYLAVVSKKYPHYRENSGYITEAMRLKAWELQLGTCWLSVEDHGELERYLGLNEDQEVTSIIAIGYPYSGIFKSDISPKSGRKGIEDLVYLNTWGNPCSIQELDSRGMTNIFYYTKFAPSWGNKQPWRFIIHQEKVLLVMNKEQPKSMEVEAGIVMFYFENACKDEGISGKWNLSTEEIMEEEYHIPEDYQLVGYYSM